jgi:DNA-binding HxlR family transcriptional regulator
MYDKELLLETLEQIHKLTKTIIISIIRELALDNHRFNGLKNSIGISARELSKRLEVLENIGAVNRRLISEKPIKVEYSLTKAGKELTQAIETIHEWTVKNKKRIKINYLNVVNRTKY